MTSLPAVEVETVNAFCGGFDTRRVDIGEYLQVRSAHKSMEELDRWAVLAEQV